MTAILGSHLSLLGLGALFLVWKAISLGLYDTFASGGGDIRILKTITVNSYSTDPHYAFLIYKDTTAAQ